MQVCQIPYELGGVIHGVLCRLGVAMKIIAKKYKKWIVGFVLLVLAGVCFFKPEYAENVARAFMVILLGV